MPLKQSHLERQFQKATAKFDSWVGHLDEKGIAEGNRKKDPIWRSLRSQCRQIKKRISAAAAVVALDEELKANKAARASAVVEEKPKEKKTNKKPKKSKSDKKAEAIEKAKSQSAKNKPDKKKATKKKK